MADDEEFELKLPDWVKGLLSSAESKGYQRGFEDGQKALWYDLERRVTAARPYGA